ncbi:MAG: hypothetical protein ACREJ3_07990, partial [Polyangiaceae bacterium]
AVVIAVLARAVAIVVAVRDAGVILVADDVRRFVIVIAPVAVFCVTGPAVGADGEAQACGDDDSQTGRVPPG